METFKGTIIEESLENKSVLNKVKILSTKVENVMERHKTPWIKQWTLHKVEIDPNQASDIAEMISKSLDKDHTHSWYADFKNDNIHYIIYRDKVFRVNRSKQKEYAEPTKYGLALGIPDYQIDFEKKIKK